MIALRARREAMQVVEEIAYPPIQFPAPPPPPLKRVVVTEWCSVDSIYYEPSFNFVEPPPPQPAPWWMMWVLLASLAVIFVASFLLGALTG
jgi:hypothetical protein